MNSNDIINFIKFRISEKKTFFYNFLEAILRLIDNDINVHQKTDIFKYVNIFKNKLANDLISKELYKNFDYNLKICRNDIYSNLINDNIIDENSKIYISKYINLNIVILNNNKYRFVQKYNSEMDSIILLENNHKYCPIYIIKNNTYYSIFSNNIIQEILENFSLDNRLIFNNNINITDKEHKQINKLKGYTLNKLQSICNDYEICVYKYIDTRKLLKKKNELFEELKFYLLNK
tara:strand:+ start:1160 stop:1861 length:702 start_codon:yes stop_codon:yes gene_type:complete